MKKRSFTLLVLVLLVPMILAACGGGLSEDDAEKALKASLTGDTEEANKSICDKDQIPDGSGAMPDGTEVGDVSCKKDGDKMVCDVTVTVADQDATMKATFNITDDKLCDPNIEMPGLEIPTDLPTEVPTETSN